MHFHKFYVMSETVFVTLEKAGPIKEVSVSCDL